MQHHPEVMVSPMSGATGGCYHRAPPHADSRRDRSALKWCYLSLTALNDNSLTALQYIKNKKRRFKPFVANTVNEIRNTSSPKQWRHLPMSLNPADDGSRGLGLRALKPSCRWLSRPKFCLLHEDQWPTQETCEVPDGAKEVRKERRVMIVNAGSVLDQILRRYSSWPCLQILIARLLRFFNYVKSQKTCLEGRRIS